MTKQSERNGQLPPTNFGGDPHTGPAGRMPGCRWIRAAAGHNAAMDDQFAVTTGAGSFRSADPQAVRFPHKWTPEGVTVEAAFTGAHLLHLAAAGCVLNDLYREAQGLGVELSGVKVTAAGGFDTESWSSTGITYRVELDSAAPAEDLRALLDRVDAVAEIPRAIRAGAPVQRA